MPNHSNGLFCRKYLYASALSSTSPATRKVPAVVSSWPAFNQIGTEEVTEEDKILASGSIKACATKSRARALPSFIVVGPPRTGTTWLHQVLRHHINLPGPTKETRFFDLHFDRGMNWYLDHFPQTADGRLVGEVAPTYFASSQAPNRIARVLPDVKLIFIFRQPVERLVSLYRLKRAYGRLDGSLEEALERDPELVGSSQYAVNLRKWQSNFSTSQLSINLYEDLSGDPQGFVDRLNDFLRVPRWRLPDSEQGEIFSTGQMTEPRCYLATRTATAMADWCKARKLDNIVASVRNSSLIRLFLGGGAPFPDIPTQTMQKV